MNAPITPIVIKKAIPLPVRANAASKSAYPLAEMEVGDAVEARTGSGEKAFRTEISRASTELRAKGGEFARRAFMVGFQQAEPEALAADPKAKGPLTVWRVEDKDPVVLKPRQPKPKKVATEGAAPETAPVDTPAAETSAEAEQVQVDAFPE